MHTHNVKLQKIPTLIYIPCSDEVISMYGSNHLPILHLYTYISTVEPRVLNFYLPRPNFYFESHVACSCLYDTYILGRSVDRTTFLARNYFTNYFLLRVANLCYLKKVLKKLQGTSTARVTAANRSNPLWPIFSFFPANFLINPSKLN